MQNLQSQHRLDLDSQKLESDLYTPSPVDRLNPNTWEILYFDRAIPLDPVAKAYTLKDLQSWTRNYLLIPIKLIANLLLAIVMMVTCLQD